MRPTKKRRALRAFQKTSEILNSPQSVSPFSPREGLFRQRPSHESESITHNKAILNLIHYAGVMETFKLSVMKFKGTNNPLNYKEDYNFAEKWEESSKITV